jgi:hypothetical protein
MLSARLQDQLPVTTPAFVGGVDGYRCVSKESSKPESFAHLCPRCVTRATLIAKRGNPEGWL